MKCNFCGAEKRKKTVSHPAIILIEANGKCICNQCITKATTLLKDEAYVDDKVINIQAELSPELA